MLGRKEARTLWSQLLSAWLSHFPPVRLCVVKLSLCLSLESSSPPHWGTVQMNWVKPEHSPSLQSHTYTLLLFLCLQLPHNYQRWACELRGQAPWHPHKPLLFPAPQGLFLIELVFPPPSRPAKGTVGPQSRSLPLSSGFSGSL